MKKSESPEEFQQRLMKSLREKKYKLTPQRLAIIRLLSKDKSHPGAMDILKRVRERAPEMSMSTVYYTLDILKKEGLIMELEFYDRDNRYDVNVSNHINLICKRCGKIEDFSKTLFLSSKMIEGKTGFRTIGMRLEYYGYCRNCVGKSN